MSQSSYDPMLGEDEVAALKHKLSVAAALRRQEKQRGYAKKCRDKARDELLELRAYKDAVKEEMARLVQENALLMETIMEERGRREAVEAALDLHRLNLTDVELLREEIEMLRATNKELSEDNASLQDQLKVARSVRYEVAYASPGPPVKRRSTRKNASRPLRRTPLRLDVLL